MPPQAKECQGSPETRTSKVVSFSRGFAGSTALPTPCFQTSGLQKEDRRHFRCPWCSRWQPWGPGTAVLPQQVSEWVHRNVSSAKTEGCHAGSNVSFLHSCNPDRPEWFAQANVAVTPLLSPYGWVREAAAGSANTSPQ